MSGVALRSLDDDAELVGRSGATSAAPHEAVSRPWRIVVLALEGGVGTTTVAALLAGQLAADGAAGVGVLDATPCPGGVRVRLQPVRNPSPPRFADSARPEAAPSELVECAGWVGPLTLLARSAPQAADGPETVSDRGGRSTAPTERVDVVVIDAGSRLAQMGRGNALDHADQLVVVGGCTGDGPSRTVTALDWLAAWGHGRVVRDAVTVLTDSSDVCGGTAPVDDAVRGRCRAVVGVGFDPRLGTGGVVNLAALSGRAAAAVEEIAALVARPPTPGSGGAARRSAAAAGTGAARTPGPSPAGAERARLAESTVPRRPPGLPLLWVVVCTVVALVTGVLVAGWSSSAAACADGSHGRLPVHQGYPHAAAACVPTAFGAQSAEVDNPSLLIVEAPVAVQPGADLTLVVSTRNLVRDHFPQAAEGGYYTEPAALTGDGLTRGHVHAACQLLTIGREAPPPVPVEAFAAVEDGGGGAGADLLEVHVAGRDREGRVLFPAGSQLRCAAWAGDGSHRVPMDASPRTVPAFDAVRVAVTAA